MEGAELQDITNIDRMKNRTAVAMGFFDGLHIGHRAVVKEATSYRDRGLASTVLTFDSLSSLSKLSNGDRILFDDLKYKMLEDIGIENIYRPDFKEIKDMTAGDFVKEILAQKLNAKVVICGFDFRFGRGASGDTDLLKELCAQYDIEVIVIPAIYVDGMIASSTKIREFIKSGEIDRANSLLGYDFNFQLEVVHGRKFGRIINAPTINQILPEMMILPKFGVYSSTTIVDGTEYLSITNIGMNPSIGKNKVPQAETHIIDYEGDLYGEFINVALTGFIRGELKFNSIDELAKRIQQDIESVKKINCERML